MKKTGVDFEELVGRIQTTSDALRQDALVVINRSVTARAWLTGYYIVEYEQHGRDRAKYGEGLLKKLAKRLNNANFALPSLKNYRAFYRTYPEVGTQIAVYLLDRFGKGYTACSFLPAGALERLESKGYTPCSLLTAGGLLVKNAEGVKISAEALFNRLSYSHIRELVRLNDDLQRTFMRLKRFAEHGAFASFSGRLKVCIMLAAGGARIRISCRRLRTSRRKSWMWRVSSRRRMFLSSWI